MKKIAMPRGDLRIIPFTVKEPNGQATQIQFEEIYFTVKKKYTDSTHEFQKRLTDGGITTNGMGNFWIQIDPEDTDGRAFGQYVFDIELVCLMEQIKQTVTGEFILAHEVTSVAEEDV